VTEEFWFDSKQGQEKFLCSEGSIPTVGPFLPLIHWVLGAVLLGKSDQGMKLTTFHCIVPELS
jgi:hypothetical protein